MPDNKLTDKEIIKALGCCIHDDYDYCEKCPYRKSKPCQENLIKNSFDLINRLQAENERLRKENEDYVHLYNKHINTAFNRIKAEAYKEFAEEIFELFPNDKPNTVISRVTVKHILNEKVGEQPILNDVKCKDCEYLELELPYAVCSKAYKGIVAPDDSCGKGKLKELVGEDK